MTQTNEAASGSSENILLCAISWPLASRCGTNHKSKLHRTWLHKPWFAKANSDRHRQSMVPVAAQVHSGRCRLQVSCGYRPRPVPMERGEALSLYVAKRNQAISTGEP